MITVAEPILRVNGLTKSYVQRGALTHARYMVHAFTGVNLVVNRGATLAIVGESGAGKSTLARCLALLEQPDSGEICYGGRDVANLTSRDLLPFRRQIQLMFQDSTSALNPRLPAGELIAEPLLVQNVGTPAEHRDRALDLMHSVGLPPESANKYPFEFSGGERQRIALARALALEPRLLILDEALSNLDVVRQQAMLDLLARLQAEHSLTYIHILHDLRLVSQFGREVAVMHNGKVVEQSTAEELFARPRHPYTRQLLDAMPPLDLLLLERS
jgi:ABC-type glutathione transport system ATPase component